MVQLGILLQRYWEGEGRLLFNQDRVEEHDNGGQTDLLSNYSLKLAGCVTPHKVFQGILQGFYL